MSLTHTDIINKLIQDNGYKSYLEIGLSFPQNFISIKCKNKESVDPYLEDSGNYNPFFGVKDDGAKNLVLKNLTYKMTSDEMFKTISEEKKYDIIFIDGLHLEEQVDKDIFNSLRHLSDNGCIVVHDCLPLCKNATEGSPERGKLWNGTVWKSISKLGIYGIKYVTIDADFGCCLIKKGEMNELPPICSLAFEEYELHKKELLHVVSADNFLNTPSNLLWDNFYKDYYEIRLNEDLFSRLYPKHEDDKEKYLVFTCARGENEYLNEWINHYLNMGFDKIIICDNNDDNVIEDLFRDYIERGVLEVFDFRGCKSFQVQMYSVFAQHGNYKWCGYFDCDEFLELSCYSNIKEFLETINEDCISFNWIVYGSNGKKHKQGSTVQDRFKEPVYPLCTFKENMFIKSIVRGGANNRFKNCMFNGSHIPVIDDIDVYTIGGYFKPITTSHQHFPFRYKLGYIKHYYTKSFDEWCLKSRRGWPDGTVNLSIANFFICEETYKAPLENYTNGLFLDVFECSRKPDEWFEKYDVIEITNKNGRVYSMLALFSRFCVSKSGKTYIITENIDDTLYNIMLEIALRTNNRLVFARTREEVWRAFLLYNKGITNTYYILDVL